MNIFLIILAVGYEIRDYSGYIVAEVEVDGDMKTSLNN